MLKHLRKLVALASVASLALVAPSIVPARASFLFLRGCGIHVVTFAPIDAAYARPLPIIPCPAPVHPTSPWPVVTVFVGVAGVMINAAWIWNTQCRELTSREAMITTALPLVGMLFNDHASKCKH